jgi:hypothetical protein
MMLAYYSTVEMGVIALVASTALFIWSIRSEGLGKYLAGVVGFLAIIFSVFMIFSATFHTGGSNCCRDGKAVMDQNNGAKESGKAHKK